MKEHYCEICGSPFAEKHHIVHRSQGGLNFRLNYKYLCGEHHRGNGSPHLDIKKDLQYKREMQAKLKNKLTQDYYTLNELIKELDMQKAEARKAVKTLPLSSKGYKTEEIIRRLMGSRLYIELEEVAVTSE